MAVELSASTRSRTTQSVLLMTLKNHAHEINQARDIAMCLWCPLQLQHHDKPYCNGCYQMLFGPEGYRADSIEPRKVLKKADSGDMSAAEKSVTHRTVKGLYYK